MNKDLAKSLKYFFLEYTNIINSFSSDKIKPIYFLIGDEQFYIHKIIKNAKKKIIPDEHKAFNQAIYYAKDVDPNLLISDLKQYPIGFERRLVIIKDAQNLKKIELLEAYFENPQKSTTLIICYNEKKIDQRKKIFKTLIKNHVVFFSKKIFENQLLNWIEKYTLTKNIRIEKNASQILCDYIGNNLLKISNEIDKICLDEKIKVISSEIVVEQIGVSKEYNIFELQNALGKKDKIKSLKIIKYFSLDVNKYSCALVFSSLFNYYNKLLITKCTKNKSQLSKNIGINSYFINEYIEASKNYSFNELLKIIQIIFDYDMRSKGVQNNKISSSDLQKELVIKILISNNI